MCSRLVLVKKGSIRKDSVPFEKFRFEKVRFQKVQFQKVWFSLKSSDSKRFGLKFNKYDMYYDCTTLRRDFSIYVCTTLCRYYSTYIVLHYRQV